MKIEIHIEMITKNLFFVESKILKIMFYVVIYLHELFSGKSVFTLLLMLLTSKQMKLYNFELLMLLNLLAQKMNIDV